MCSHLTCNTTSFSGSYDQTDPTKNQHNANVDEYIFTFQFLKFLSSILTFDQILAPKKPDLCCIGYAIFNSTSTIVVPNPNQAGWSKSN